MFDFTIKQGDTLPTLTDTLTYSTGVAVNLTGATVNFVMRSLTSSAPVINAAATIVNASLGQVSFSFSATQSAVAGAYMGCWVVTPSGGGTQTFPTVGYISVKVEENLIVAGGQQLVSVADAKDVLNLSAADRTHDEKVLGWINAVRPVIENITGPIIQQPFEEWHDGGHYSLTLRRRPSSAFGTTPILVINAISEYAGPIEWPLAQVASPDEGVIYSVEGDVSLGRVVRRTAGGGVSAFPDMPQSVHVWYTAGQSAVPDNVAEATLELLRLHYQESQQASRRGRVTVDDDAPSGPPIGYFIPGKVRELLVGNRRFPSIA